MTGQAAEAYGAVDNLEVMAGAVRYRRYLARCVTHEAGPPRPGLRLLDVGAGTGTHARDLVALGYDVACVEIDLGLRARLESDGFVTFPSLAAAPGGFDVVYSFNVLEHIEDDRQAYREMVEQARAGGTVVLYVPALPMLYSSMDRKVGHLRRYHRRTLLDLARDADVAVRRCSYVDSLGVAATLVYKLVGSDRGDIGARSVGAYDRFAFPVSRGLDRVAQRAFGKNLLLVTTRR